MPTIPPISDAAASDVVGAAFEQLRSHVGSVPIMYRSLAHAPAALAAVMAMGKAIRSDLDPKLRELVYLKTTQLTDCHY
jgi:alkylhydroperoxidase family enzyme